jgi:outer membrane lipoprotein-sorting protein
MARRLGVRLAGVVGLAWIWGGGGAAPLLRNASTPPAAWASPGGAGAVPGAPSVDELLARIDRNLTFETRTATMSMTVTRNGRTKTYRMRSWSRGADEAAVEYLEPARDKGTKMLKKGPELWTWMPAVERTQKIAGHMLRQGMMGSDMSYEDMMQASGWRALYQGTVTGQETVDGRPCWKVELVATRPDVTYARRIVLVDAASGVPVRQELYAVSGMLLKSWTMSDVVEIGGRAVPRRMVVEDRVQSGSRTELTFSDLAFAVPLEAEIFNVRWLER